MPALYNPIVLAGIGGIANDVITAIRHQAISLTIERTRLTNPEQRKRLQELLGQIITAWPFDSAPPDQVTYRRTFPSETDQILPWPDHYQQMLTPSGGILLEESETPPYVWLKSWLDQNAETIRKKQAGKEAEANPFFGRTNAQVNIKTMASQVHEMAERVKSLTETDAWGEATEMGLNVATRREIHLFIGGGGGQGTGGGVQLLACVNWSLRQLNIRDLVVVKVVVMVPPYNQATSQVEARAGACRALRLLEDFATIRQGRGFSLPHPDGNLVITDAMAERFFDSLYLFEPTPHTSGDAFLQRVVHTWAELHFGLASGTRLRKSVESNSNGMGTVHFAPMTGDLDLETTM